MKKKRHELSVLLQIVLVSVGAGRQTRKLDGSIPSASLPIPPRDKLPMMLLNQEPFFGQLITMLEKLSRLDLTAAKLVRFHIVCVNQEPFSAG